MRKELPTEEEILSLGSPLARFVELHEEVVSTQARAKELAGEGAPDGTAVISRIQTGGRGRLGRLWGSPAGGLWMSLVLRPDFEARLAPRITQAAAVGVAKALRGFGARAEIKWPNDILVSGRKICGILAESSAEAGGGIGFVVLGVGLNANLDIGDLGVSDDRATTLRRELGRDVAMVDVMAGILTRLDAELRRVENFDGVLDDWRKLNCTLGRRVKVVRLGEVLEGEAVDVTREGALILRAKNTTVELFEGEIENLRPQPPRPRLWDTMHSGGSEGGEMFDSIISGLEDRSAAGIDGAAKSGAIPDDAQYSKIISEARTLVEEGRGGWRYIGSLGDLPQWEPPAGEERAEEPPPPEPQTL